MIYRVPGFLAVVYSSPPPPPPLPSASCLSFSVFLCTAGRAELTDRRGERGAGEEPNHTTARKPGPLCIVRYSLANIVNASTYHTERRNTRERKGRRSLLLCWKHKKDHMSITPFELKYTRPSRYFVTITSLHVLSKTWWLLTSNDNE
jgi:hypothetical protein